MSDQVDIKNESEDHDDPYENDNYFERYEEKSHSRNSSVLSNHTLKGNILVLAPHPQFVLNSDQHPYLCNILIIL